MLKCLIFNHTIVSCESSKYIQDIEERVKGPFSYDLVLPLLLMAFDCALKEGPESFVKTYEKLSELFREKDRHRSSVSIEGFIYNSYTKDYERFKKQIQSSST
jgi:hypothetical protein